MDNYKNVALIETDNLGGRTLPPHSLLANLTGDQERIRGLYRIERMVQKPRYDGQPYWMVELSDCSRSLICYGWPGSLNYDIPFERHTIVQVEIVTRLFNNKIVADIREMEMIKTPVLHGIELLPSPLCPVSGVLIRLAQLVRDIEVPVLKQFLNHMLSRDEIVLPFLTAPASICYHHNYPGGLLEHSVEVAEIVAGLPILMLALKIIDDLKVVMLV